MLSSSYKRPCPRSNKRNAASCGQDGHQNCFNELQRAFALVMRSRAFEGLLRLECHRLRGDRDNMVRRTLKVGRDLKPPCNPGLNGVLLVSIDEEMCPLRFQRQQRHVDHGQTHASATSSSARYYYVGIVNRECDMSYRRRNDTWILHSFQIRNG